MKSYGNRKGVSTSFLTSTLQNHYPILIVNVHDADYTEAMNTKKTEMKDGGT